MELQPTTETGKGLFQVLQNWIQKSPESAVDKLKRIFLNYSLEMQNEEKFVTLLYGQGVLDESPSVLCKTFPTTLLRAQHATETTLNKRSFKELVVALELSENGSILTEVLNWAEKHSSEITESMRSLSMDLAPERVRKMRALSELTPGRLTPKHREINWPYGEKRCSVLEVCKSKIMVGWTNGQIKVYDSATLSCTAVLNYCKSPAGVTCLHGTCTEVIAGYADGNICVWNIVKGLLVSTLDICSDVNGIDCASCMRLKDSLLVVGTVSGRVKIWQWVSSSLTLLGSWDAGIHNIAFVDFNDDYIILHDGGECVITYHFNGKKSTTISCPAGISAVALFENYVITAREGGVDLGIWGFRDGASGNVLSGHKEPVINLDVHAGVLASLDKSGMVILWSARGAVEGRPAAQLTSFIYPHPSWSLSATTNYCHSLLKLGQRFVAGIPLLDLSPRLVLTEFSS